MIPANGTETTGAFDPRSVAHETPPSSTDPAIPPAPQVNHVKLSRPFDKRYTVLVSSPYVVATLPRLRQVNHVKLSRPFDKRLTVLVSSPYVVATLPRLRQVFESLNIEVLVPNVKERLSEEMLMEYVGQYDATICGNDKYTRRVLEAMSPRLKGVIKWGTGIDSIDQEAARDCGIEVRNVPNGLSVPVSDSVLGYMLLFARQQVQADRLMKSGVWKKIPSHALRECTLGVIGCGNIGKHVVLKAAAFGTRILVNDVREIDPEFLERYKAKQVPLEYLLRNSDYVSLNCDLNPTSRFLINKDTLRRMKPNAILINCARGPVVKEKDLVDALQGGWIRGAALDTHESEPLGLESPLVNMNNVYLAPHNASNSPVTWEATHWTTIRNACEVLGIPIEVSRATSKL